MAVDLVADLAFCLPSRTAGVDGVEVTRRVWPFAQAADRVTVALDDLPAADNGAADWNADAGERELLTLLREGGADSLRVDEEALRTYAIASAVEDDVRTGDAVDEAIRKRLAAIFLQLVPSGTVGEWLDLDSLTYAFTEDGRGLVFRVPIRAGRTSTDICVVAQLDAAQPTIPEGCNEPRGLNRTFWEVLERQVMTEAVATLWDRAEEELESLVEEVPPLERVIDVLVGQARTANADGSIRATISTERAVLELRMPAAVEALGLSPLTPVRPADLTGRLALVMDFATGEIGVDAIPEIDFRSVAERFYGAFGGPGTGVPALSVTTRSVDEIGVCSGGGPGLRLAFDRRWPLGGTDRRTLLDAGRLAL